MNAASVALLVVMTFAGYGCDDGRPPTQPDRGAAAINLENMSVTARRSNVTAPEFTYGISLLLRETGGGSGTMTQVSAAIRDRSGAATEAGFAGSEAFGTTRFAANAVLPATGLTLSGPRPATHDVSVRVDFVDDLRRAGTAQASQTLNADLTGNWSGPGPTLSPGDWSKIGVRLVQRDDILTGDVTTRDDRTFPLSGCVGCADGPRFVLSGLTNASGICGVGFNLMEFRFAGGQLRSILIQYSGRCPGTTFGTFELQR